MAYDYDQQRYRPSSQNSLVDLSSSHCYLDGVPFKISPAFRRPSQPNIPPELLKDTSTEALHEEYVYDTEEAVLAWSRAREEAKAKALADARARAAIAAAATESNSSDSSDEEVEAPDATPTNGTSASAAATAAPAPEQPRPPAAAVKPPWELPVSAGNTILTPTRMPTTTKVQSPLAPPRGAQVDLALFEQEGDPFDTMELQTIDDMAELRTVLGGVTVGGAGSGGGASQEALPPSGPSISTEQVVKETPEVENCYGNITTSSAVGSALVGGTAAVVNTSSSASCHVYENVVVRPSGVAAVAGNEQPGAGATNSPVVPDSGHANATTANVNSNNCNNPDPLATTTRDKRFVIEPTGDGDYVQIRPDYSKSAVCFHKDSSASSFSSAADSAPIYGNIVGLARDAGMDKGEEDPASREPPQEQYANCQALKPTILPPIQPRQDSLSADGAAGNALGFSPAAQHSLPTQFQTNVTGGSGVGLGFAAGGMSQSAYVMPASASGGVVDGQRSSSDFMGMMNHHTYSNVPSATSSTSSGPRMTPASSSSPAFYNNMYSRYGNLGSSPSNSSSPTPLANNGERGALRSAKSNPDLSVMSQSPSPQPWNPYKPLPPTPVSELRSSSSSTESLPNDQQQQHHHSSSSSATTVSSNNAATSSAGPPPEVDPYNSLSHDAKTFVNNLTSMGFPRSRAARAVEKFGADEREVLDHLFNVDKLVEKKFTPAQAETGLQLFKNDIRKAEQFLDLYQQFTELGFTGERIQTALVKHQLDRDKALDYLTA